MPIIEKSLNKIPEDLRMQRDIVGHKRYLKKKVYEGYIYVRNNNFCRKGLSY